MNTDSFSQSRLDPEGGGDSSDWRDVLGTTSSPPLLPLLSPWHSIIRSNTADISWWFILFLAHQWTRIRFHDQDQRPFNYPAFSTSLSLVTIYYIFLIWPASLGDQEGSWRCYCKQSSGWRDTEQNGSDRAMALPLVLSTSWPLTPQGAGAGRTLYWGCAE